MATTTTTTTIADSITLNDFKDLLSKYPALIKTIAKTPKEGQPSLEDLDRFRYIDAPSRLSVKTGAKQIELPDIEKLVQWKIRHGKFRPFLPKLVASNTEETAVEVTKNAFASYAAKSDVKGTVTIIAQLKGIGPATASLILAVHDPENVVFFSDEAYHWLCAPDSETAPDLKYNAKEYEELHAKARALMARLKVSPIDIEKVAYVLKREIESDSTKKKSVGRPKGRQSSPEDSPKSGILAGRSRGRPKKALQSVMSEVEDSTEANITSTQAGRPRGRPKPASKPESSKSKPEKATTKEVSPVDSKATARKSKRKADEMVPDDNKTAPRRGRPKGRAG